jgi:hypothetical protein
MKKHSVLLAIVMIAVISCVDHTIPAEYTNYMKATVDGQETIYTILSEAESFISTNSHSVQFVFRETADSDCRSWLFATAGIDIDKITFPYTFSGPTFDYAAQLPAFWIMLNDRCVGSYGAQIYSIRDFDNEVTLTLGSLRNDVLTGHYEGKTVTGEATHGAFQVKLIRRPM